DGMDGMEGGRLRLEFREVWWAESFGLPKVGPALHWARVQFREQLAHLLLPAGFRLGPAQTARRAPARQIAQALTYQPQMTADRVPARPDAALARPAGSAPATAAAPTDAPPVVAAGTPPRRMPRTPPPTRPGPGMWVADLVQYVWKLAQWLILTPLIS